MVTPRWVRVRAQPIAIEDVLAYLLAALDRGSTSGEVFEIGGADLVTYLDLMHEYASQRGLRRTMIPVPVLTPRLSSLWLWLVTPVYAGVGRKLVDTLQNETVVEDHRALEVFRVRPRGIHDAIARALAFEDRAIAETRWSDEAFAEAASYGGVRHGSRLVDSRAATVALPPARAFAPIQAIGGETGWYKGARSGRLRGLLDVRRRRPGPAARAARSRRPRGRRHARLLARRGVRAGPPAAAPRGDEGAGPRLAAVRGLARRRKAGRRSPRLRSSTHRASSASPTGTRCGRSTTTSSAACCATSSPPRTALAPESGRRSKSAQTRHRHVTPLALAFLPWRRHAE